MPRPSRHSNLRAVPTPRSIERRQAIVKAARDLVAQAGFHATQMVDVAQRAGVALGTLYRYFPSKAELMIEVIHMVSERELAVAAAAAAGSESAIERLAISAWTFASRALRGRKMAHALLAEVTEPAIEAVRQTYRRKLARVFETIIEQGIRNREFPAQEIQAAGACIVGSLIEGLIGPLAVENRAQAERLKQTRAAVAFCVRGVSRNDDAFVLPDFGKDRRSPSNR
jgi:AcrR family transcriptional regulator